MHPPTVLLVDDDKNSLKGLMKILEQDGYRVLGATNGYEALHLLDQEAVDILVTDMKMPGLDGFALLEEINKREEEVSVIMMTAYGSVHTAVEAMKKGAEDYLTKPLNVEELEIILARVWKKRELLLQNTALKEQLRSRYRFANLIGNTPAMQRLFKTITHVAPSKASILILGETGTGKELVARAIHQGSRRAEKPFVTVNCSALAEGVLESELFGHERGAFTGAIRGKQGRFELAHGGTLFLDEVGDMPFTVQTKLLRVLELGEFERVGSEKTLQVDVRLIAATNKNLEAEMRLGRFREDLYYRLNVITLHLPPLRERRDDIPLLADHFLQQYMEENEKKIKGFLPQTIELLQEYPWPGNVRELENIIERAVVLCQELWIEPRHLPSHLRPAPEKTAARFSLPLGVSLKEVEKEVILRTLQLTGGNKTQAAKILGISTRKIEYKVKEWEAEETSPPEFS